MQISKKYTLKPKNCILNEFYSFPVNTHVTKGISFKQYKKRIIFQLIKLIENNGLLYTNDEIGLLRHMLSEKIRKTKKIFNNSSILTIPQNFKTLMREKSYRKIFYCAMILIFSCEISEKSSLLSLSCCLSPTHFSFCKLKWAALSAFTQKSFLESQSLTPCLKLHAHLSPYLTEDTDNLLIN